MSCASPRRACPAIPKIAACAGACVVRTLADLAPEGFDLVHIHTPFIAHYAGVRAARRLNIPCIETYHTFFEEYLHHYVPVLPRAASHAHSAGMSRRWLRPPSRCARRSSPTVSRRRFILFPPALSLIHI